MNDHIEKFQKKAAAVLVGGGALVVFLHVFATYTGLYRTAIWFDTIPHFLAGAVAASGAVWVLAVFRPELEFSLRVTAIVLLFALGVGISWEVFEHFVGLFKESNYALDTTIDVIMDITGASVFLLWIRR